MLSLIRCLFCLLLLFPVITSTLWADEREEINFIQHLVDRQFWGDVIFAVEQMEEDHSNWLQHHPDTHDSLQFNAGWAAYNREELSYASERFKQISPESPDFLQSAFYRSYLLAHLSVNENHPGFLETATEELQQLEPDQQLHQELQNFELAGMALLDRNYDQFETLSDGFTGQYYAFAEQEESLLDHHQDLANAGGKSPFAAGLMSAVIPGSGKLYAGRRGDGISTFLQVAIFGSVFAESAINAGWDHPRTWISGGAFGLFYSANIWGSVVAVRITKEEIHEQVDQRILLDLHIPLRSVF